MGGKRKKKLKRKHLRPKTVAVKTESIEVGQDEMVPLTYPPHLLKKDLLKTAVITIIILGIQMGLYYYDQNFGIESLPEKLSSIVSQIRF